LILENVTFGGKLSFKSTIAQVSNVRVSSKTAIAVHLADNSAVSGSGLTVTATEATKCGLLLEDSKITVNKSFIQNLPTSIDATNSMVSLTDTCLWGNGSGTGIELVASKLVMQSSNEDTLITNHQCGIDAASSELYMNSISIVNLGNGIKTEFSKLHLIDIDLRNAGHGLYLVNTAARLERVTGINGKAHFGIYMASGTTVSGLRTVTVTGGAGDMRVGFLGSQRYDGLNHFDIAAGTGPSQNEMCVALL
jgi:hypothetical protein